MLLPTFSSRPCWSKLLSVSLLRCGHAKKGLKVFPAANPVTFHLSYPLRSLLLHSAPFLWLRSSLDFEAKPHWNRFSVTWQRLLKQNIPTGPDGRAAPPSAKGQAPTLTACSCLLYHEDKDGNKSDESFSACEWLRILLPPPSRLLLIRGKRANIHQQVLEKISLWVWQLDIVQCKDGGAAELLASYSAAPYIFFFRHSNSCWKETGLGKDSTFAQWIVLILLNTSIVKEEIENNYETELSLS